MLSKAVIWWAIPCQNSEYGFRIAPEVHHIAIADNVLFAFNDQAHVAPCPGGAKAVRVVRV